MKFKSALFAAAAPAVLLVACTDAETDSAKDVGESSESTEQGASLDENAGEAGEAEAAEAQAKPEVENAAPAKSGTWSCEDQGDVEVTFAQAADGTATLTYKNMSEMAMNEPPEVTELKAGPAGDPIGNPGKSGRLASADGTSVTWHLDDGRVEVTEGDGEDPITYYCAKAG